MGIRVFGLAAVALPLYPSLLEAEITAFLQLRLGRQMAASATAQPLPHRT